ncbi:hypothetical protein [Clostridium butyricum]|nr:hypothetical protein [Clostridium butyricum]
MAKISKNNEINKFRIVVWHSETMYVELLFGLNNEDFAQKIEEIENYDLYFGDEFEDVEENMDEVYKIAQKLKRKISSWINGTWLKNIEISIEEQNV